MKKLLVIFTLCIFLLSGCGQVYTKQESYTEQQSNSDEIFITIEREKGMNLTYEIVYHKDTKVMYAVSNGYYNSGNFTLLVNPDGSPMLYEAESEE